MRDAYKTQFSMIMHSFANHSNFLSMLYTFLACYADMVSYILCINMYVLTENV